MKRLLLICLLLSGTVGCTAIVPKEFADVLSKPMKDGVIASMLAAYHKKEGKWPQNISEATESLSKDKPDAKKELIYIAT